MITLATSKARFSGFQAHDHRFLARLSTDPKRPLGLRRREAFVVGRDAIPEGFGCYIAIEGSSEIGSIQADQPILYLPSEFDYLSDGDVLRLDPKRSSIRALFADLVP